MASLPKRRVPTNKCASEGGWTPWEFHNLQGIQSDENGISYRISRDFCCALMGFKMGLQLLKILEDVMGFHGGIMGDFPTKSIIMGHIPGNLLRLRPGSHGPFSQI